MRQSQTCLDGIHCPDPPSAKYPLPEITPRDVDLLNRYFSTKTVFDVKLDCSEEARELLRASLSDSSVQHALIALKTLREDLEQAGDSLNQIKLQTPSHHYSIQQYSKALGELASNLTDPGEREVKSALHCCQVFISIEQVRKNYTAMAQHMIKGFGIMRENRDRPMLSQDGRLIPSRLNSLPLLDVFVIKLFMAPCRFTCSPDISRMGAPVSSGTSTSVNSDLERFRQAVEHEVDARAEITRIAALTVEFLHQVSLLLKREHALELIPQKAALLTRLNSWLTDTDLMQTRFGYPHPEPVSLSFLRIFHRVLRITLLGSLNFSTGSLIELHFENEELQSLADRVCERVRSYVTHIGSRDERMKV